MRANSDLAVAFSKLFWPDFVTRLYGCILLAEQYSPEAYERWKTRVARGQTVHRTDAQRRSDMGFLSNQ